MRLILRKKYYVYVVFVVVDSKYYNLKVPLFLMP